MKQLRVYVGETINGCLILEELPSASHAHWSHAQKHNNRLFRVKHLKSGVELQRTLIQMRNSPLKMPQERRGWIDFTGMIFDDIEVLEFDMKEYFDRVHLKSERGFLWKCKDTITGELFSVGTYELRKLYRRQLRENEHKGRAMRTWAVHGFRCNANSPDYISDPLYNLWQSVKQRCHSPSHRQFIHFGGKGLTMCDEWQEDFVVFRNDIIGEIGERPDNHSLFVKSGKVFRKGNVAWVLNSRGTPLSTKYASRLQEKEPSI